MTNDDRRAADIWRAKYDRLSTEYDRLAEHLRETSDHPQECHPDDAPDDYPSAGEALSCRWGGDEGPACWNVGACGCRVIPHDEDE